MANILFTAAGDAIAPKEIRRRIAGFGHSYFDAVQRIIRDSVKLDREGEVCFVKCASLILRNFKMTRSGPFKVKASQSRLLHNCWEAVGDHLTRIRASVPESGPSRERFLLGLDGSGREELVSDIWLITKRLLPFTMGKTSYGLVGASKILFAALPEVVLPIDNSQWLHVFKTVDMGDVIRGMVRDIQDWESATGEKLNQTDDSGVLTTLPSVYNVIAMAARPKIEEARYPRFT